MLRPFMESGPYDRGARTKVSSRQPQDSREPATTGLGRRAKAMSVSLAGSAGGMFKSWRTRGNWPRRVFRQWPPAFSNLRGLLGRRILVNPLLSAVSSLRPRFGQRSLSNDRQNTSKACNSAIVGRERPLAQVGGVGTRHRSPPVGVKATSTADRGAGSVDGRAIRSSGATPTLDTDTDGCRPWWR